jgi:transcriptional regulator with XRE-family HTH domain
MDEKQTFGAFLTEKRLRSDYTLRALAAELGVSAVYICDVEKDRKAAPRRELLDMLVVLLQLSEDEKNEMFDLAASTKDREKAISPDLPEYIMDKDVVRTALRTAKQYNIEDDEWLDFIEKIKKKNRTAK